MPSAYITLEYVTSKWVCEVEAQDAHLASRRQTVVADTIEEAIDQVYAAYRKVVPGDVAKVLPVPDVPLEPVTMPTTGLKIVRREDRNRSQRDAVVLGTVPTGTLGQDVAAALKPVESEPSIDEVEAEDRAEIAGLEALRAEAAGLGIEVDGRWGERRLRRAIEARQPL